MKIFLRRSDTGLLYAGGDRWTANSGEAFDFQATDRALDHANHGGFSEVELLMQFENPTFEIPMSIVGLGT